MYKRFYWILYIEIYDGNMQKTGKNTVVSLDKKAEM